MTRPFFTKEDYIKALYYLQLITKDPPSQLQTKCPFHEDKTPSLSINIDKGIYQCFSCKDKGTIASLFHKVTNTYLSHYLNKKIEPNKLFTLGIKKKQETQKPLFKELNRNIFNDLIPLRDSIEAQAYLSRRKLGGLISKGFESYYAEQLQIDGQDFSNRLIVPIYYNTNLINLEARSLDELNKAKRKCIYVKGHSINILYDLDVLNKKELLFVFEGLMDCLLFKTTNYSILQNSTCTFGSSLSNYQLELLKQFNKVVLIPDNDEAGEKMIEKLKDTLDKSKFEVARIPESNKYKDLGDLVKLENKSIEDLIENGWLKEYFK